MESSSGEGRCSRIGRVRKQSAKVLEMEEAEQLERQLYKTGTPKSKRQSAAATKEKQEPLPKLVVRTIASPQAEKVVVQVKPKVEPEIQSPSLPSTAEEESDGSSEESESDTPVVEPPTTKPIVVKKGRKRSGNISDYEVTAPEKKMKMKLEDEEEDDLCIDTDDGDELESDGGNFADSLEESETVDIEDTSFDLVITPSSVPQPPSTTPKTKKEPAKKSAKGGAKKSAKKEDTTEKKKRAPTAYILWCNSERANLVAKYPNANFAQVSKLLGEQWKNLPEKDKLQWKGKAKKMTAKGSTLIQTGKAPPKSVNQTTAQTHTAQPQNNVPTPKPAPDPVHDLSMLYKSRGNPNSGTPIDVAAHLKLLGDALSILGKRIQEHQGHLAVQGSLSVLLDSLISALGPLVCLTNLLPETSGCPPEVHAATLDNIAYIMPGIG